MSASSLPSGSASSSPDQTAPDAPRELANLPPPDARAAREDLPAGATCRIGSARLASGRSYSELIFASTDRLYMEGLGRWTVADTGTGAPADDFELGVVTSGYSMSGACVAVLTDATANTVELYKMPARRSLANRRFPEDRYSDIVPADDCSGAMQGRATANRA